MEKCAQHEDGGLAQVVVAVVRIEVGLEVKVKGKSVGSEGGKRSGFVVHFTNGKRDVATLARPVCNQFAPCLKHGIAEDAGWLS